MIVIMEQKATEQQTDAVVGKLMQRDMQVQINKGVECTVLGVLGDTASIDQDKLALMEGVERIVRVQEPYKKANKKFHPQPTIIPVGEARIGSEELAIIAGPCSIESEKQLTGIAKEVKHSGSKLLRGGAFKMRTSPYAFQGLKKEGLEMLYEAGKQLDMPVVTELIAPRQVELFDMMVDVIQIGTRNMLNFDLLKEVGQTRKPILLKRGMSSTVEEWLMSAEYIMAQGNPNVILCERGIRTFETYTRNTLDLSAVVAVKRLSHLPVVVDPSHGTGHSWMVPSMAVAAIAAGADGLIIEVHNDPVNALCDGAQSILPSQFDDLMNQLRQMAPIFGRTVPNPQEVSECSA